MNGSSDELLSSATLFMNQHDAVAMRESVHFVKMGLHRLCLTERTVHRDSRTLMLMRTLEIFSQRRISGVMVWVMMLSRRRCSSSTGKHESYASCCIASTMNVGCMLVCNHDHGRERM